MNAASTRLRAVIVGGLICGATAAMAAGAQPTTTGNATTAAHAKGKTAGPTWLELNADQREALAPLAEDWDKFDAVRKRKWLDIAVRYKELSPEGQQKMHERMPDLARLTPEQRTIARENFKRAYALPPEQRRALTERFQELPEEKKQELAEQARKKTKPAVRRPGSAPALAKSAPAAQPHPAVAGSPNAGNPDATSKGNSP